MTPHEKRIRKLQRRSNARIKVLHAKTAKIMKAAHKQGFCSADLLAELTWFPEPK